MPAGMVQSRKVISAKAKLTMNILVVVESARPDLYRTARVKRFPRTPKTPIKVYSVLKIGDVTTF